MTDIYFSADRRQLLEQELNELTTVKRAEIASEIELAKSHGDLSENAEYHSARENQAKLEDRIREIEYLLKNGKIIEKTTSDVVSVGSRVRVKNLTKDVESEYSIVGGEEQDVMTGKISNLSPIAQALLGSKIGDIVSFQSPNGENQLEIITIQ